LYEKCLNLNVSTNLVSLGNCTDEKSDWSPYPYYQSDYKDPKKNYPSFTNYQGPEGYLRNDSIIINSNASTDFSKSTWKYSKSTPTDPGDDPPCKECGVNPADYAATRKGPGMLSNGPKGWNNCISVQLETGAVGLNTASGREAAMDNVLVSIACDAHLQGGWINSVVPWFKEVDSTTSEYKKKIMMCRLDAVDGEWGYCATYTGSV